MQHFWWRKWVHITTRQDSIRRMPTCTRQSQGALSMVIPEGVPNGEKAMRGVYVQLIPPEATLVGRVTSLTRSMMGICNVRLQIWRESCAMHGGSTSHLAPNHYLRSQMELVIGGDRELHQARLSPMRRSTAINVRVEVHIAGAWVTMPWTKPWVKFPSHLLRET